MSLYRRGNVYWSRIVRNGQRFERNTKQSNLNKARIVEARWLTEIDATGGIIPPSLYKSHKRTLLVSIEGRIFKHWETTVPSKRTVDFYKQVWKRLVFSSLSQIPLHRIKTADIQHFINEKSERNLSTSRKNAYLRTLRRVLRLAHEWGLIADVPKIRLLPGEAHREFVITDEVLAKMLAHDRCTEFLRQFIPFMLDTGLRLSESLALQWKHVMLSNVRRSVIVEKGKTKYARRRVPLTDRAFRILRSMQQGRPDEFVWQTQSRHYVSEQFRTLRDAMKLPRTCVVHSTRHTFCTRLAEAGVAAFELQRLAGHSSVVMSQRYTHLHEERLDDAISKLESKK